MIDFYSSKKKNLPRFLYRNYVNHIKKNNINNVDALKIFQKIIDSATGGDFNKFTWNLPIYYKHNFEKEFILKLREILKNKRKKKLKKITKLIYPHVSDEFSLNFDFLSQIFDTDNFPKFKNTDIFFSFGSCFARNFTTFLKTKNIEASNFGQIEDLNSPGSNSTILKCIHLEKKDLEKYIINNVNIFWKTSSNYKKDEIVKKKIEEIQNLKNQFLKANKIIITLGNIIDYYTKKNNKDILAPKFISIETEDINQKTKSNQKMLSSKTYLRMSSFSETRSYIFNIYESIRKISNNIDIIFTVSPVPIDNVLGIENKLNLNAIEIDCISKSTIRAALYELMISEIIKDKKCFYLPSYEIIKWVAPMIGKQVYGFDDAASRHVSNIYLNTVCEFIYFHSFEL